MKMIMRNKSKFNRYYTVYSSVKPQYGGDKIV